MSVKIYIGVSAYCPCSASAACSRGGGRKINFLDGFVGADTSVIKIYRIDDCSKSIVAVYFHIEIVCVVISNVYLVDCIKTSIAFGI